VSNLREETEKKLKKEGTSLEEVLNKKDPKDNKYSIHQDCSVVGVDVARRPKY
jgi:hypothetical protein